LPKDLNKTIKTQMMLLILTHHPAT